MSRVPNISISKPKKGVAYFLRRNKDYLVVIGLFTISLAIAIAAFYRYALGPDMIKYIPILLSFIGISFSISQFIVNIITGERKKRFDLRYAFYKESVKQVEDISNIIQESYLRGADTHALNHRLTSRVNEFLSAFYTNEEYLFSGLKQQKGCKHVVELICKLLERMHQYIAEHASSTDDVKTSVYKSWSKESRPMLAELIQQKYNYFAEIRHYL